MSYILLNDNKLNPVYSDDCFLDELSLLSGKIKLPDKTETLRVRTSQHISIFA